MPTFQNPYVTRAKELLGSGRLGQGAFLLACGSALHLGYSLRLRTGKPQFSRYKGFGRLRRFGFPLFLVSTSRARRSHDTDLEYLTA